MRVAILGLGLIGSIWARHWHADGHDVRAWNRSPRANLPYFTPDLATAVAGAGIVAVVVSDGPAALAVLQAAAPALEPGATVCLHSTVGVDECRQLAALVRARGCRFLDLPFTGSTPGAERRASVMYVGDDHDDLDLVRPVYEFKDGRGFVGRWIPVGGVGQAMALKLALNLAIAGVWQATAEAIALAGSAGVDAEHFFAGLEHNVARSGVADLKRPKVLADEVSPQFAVQWMRKDLRLAQALAGAGRLPMLDGLVQSYVEAGALGLDDLDYWTLLRVLRAGFKNGGSAPVAVG